MRRREFTRRQRRNEDDDDQSSRWLISYADFITLLFAFFVVMFSISTINPGKHRVLADNLEDIFDVRPRSPQPLQIGQESQRASKLKTQLPEKAINIQAEQKVDRLQLARIADEVKRAMQPLISQELIQVTYNPLWVEVEINTSLLFNSASAKLENSAYPALRKLADVLEPLPNHVEVEGHTDNLPIQTPIYPSNWELSAARAASVVHLFTRNGIQPDRLAAIGYGQFRPASSNQTQDGRRRNRRVKIVILADKNARRAVEIDQKMVKDKESR